MSSEKKFFVVLLAVAMLATIGCSRNKKQDAYAPVATGIAPAPAIQAVAPAPAMHRSSSYLK